MGLIGLRAILGSLAAISSSPVSSISASSPSDATSWPILLAQQLLTHLLLSMKVVLRNPCYGCQPSLSLPGKTLPIIRICSLPDSHFECVEGSSSLQQDDLARETISKATSFCAEIAVIAHI